MLCSQLGRDGGFIYGKQEQSGGALDSVLHLTSRAAKFIVQAVAKSGLTFALQSLVQEADNKYQHGSATGSPCNKPDLLDTSVIEGTKKTICCSSET